jgi:hypothetical protein
LLRALISYIVLSIFSAPSYQSILVHELFFVYPQITYISLSMLVAQIKIGCGSSEPSLHNVSLQYSTDSGATWQSVRDFARSSDSDEFTGPPRGTPMRDVPQGYSLQKAAGRRIQTFGENWNYLGDFEEQNDDSSLRGRKISARNEAGNGRVDGAGLPRHRVSPDCLHELRAPSVYYWNSAPGWRREVIPLSALQICG